MPFIRPEAPKPAMARPTMSMGDDWAAPQSVDPSSKIAKKVRKDHWITVSEAHGDVSEK